MNMKTYYKYKMNNLCFGILANDNVCKFTTAQDNIELNSEHSTFNINNKIVSFVLNEFEYLGFKETAILNMQYLIKNMNKTRNEAIRINPITKHRYKTIFYEISKSNEYILYFFNFFTYGFYGLFKNKTLIYAMDSFNFIEYVRNNYNLNKIRKYTFSMISSIKLTKSPEVLIQQKKTNPQNIVFCFWGSGYSDSLGNSGLFRPNIAKKVFNSLDESTIVSWETIYVNEPDWIQKNLRIYKNKIESYLETQNEDKKIIFLGHSQGCIFALLLSKIIKCEKIIFIAAQTVESMELFMEQKKINQSFYLYKNTFINLYNDIIKNELDQESLINIYKEYFGDDFFRILDLIKFRFENEYSQLLSNSLFIYGTKDLQINMKNYEKTKKIFKKNKNISIKSINGMNHYLMNAELGGIGDYSAIHNDVPIELTKILRKYVYA